MASANPSRRRYRIRGLASYLRDRDPLPAVEETAPPSSAAPQPSSSAPQPSSAAHASPARFGRRAAGAMAQGLSSPAPTPRRSSRTTAGAVAQGPACPGGAKPSSPGTGHHEKIGITDDGKALVKQSNEKAKALLQESIDMAPHEVLLAKYSNMWSQRADESIKIFKRDMKVNLLEKLSSDQIDKNIEHLTTALETVQKELSSALLGEFSVLQGLSGGVTRKSQVNGRKKVALMYDEGMLLHLPPDINAYEENPMRLTAVMDTLLNENIIQSCDLVKFGEASEAKLLAVHSPNHLKNIMSISSMDQNARDVKTQKAYPNLYYSEGSTKAALLAAGGVLKACEVVASGMYNYAFAVVRPPGHHASKTKPDGFCLLNNIAVGAADLLKHHRFGKIMIIDFDIHHGNGTQSIFYDDARVLTFSVHRRDDEFYPVRCGFANEIGKGSGTGFNVNVCWEHPEIRDADYLAMWDYVVIPLLEEFRPDIILISAGFDAADGDKLGECRVSKSGFALLLYKLKRFGRIVLALEGGYNLEALSNGVASCMKVLLGDEDCATFDTSELPYSSTWKTILNTRKNLSPYWVAFQTQISNEITSKSTKYIPKPRKE